MKHSTLDKVKFKRLQRRLNLSLKETIGLLELLWRSTIVNAMAGDIGKIDNEAIAIECDFDGDPDFLVETLVECGWVDKCQVHRLVVHDWKDHAPSFVRGSMKSQNLPWAIATPYSGPLIDTGESDAELGRRGSVDQDIAPQFKTTSTKPNQAKPNQAKGGVYSPPHPESEIELLLESWFDQMRSRHGHRDPVAEDRHRMDVQRNLDEHDEAYVVAALDRTIRKRSDYIYWTDLGANKKSKAPEIIPGQF